MAALSARCVQSLTRASVQISRKALSANGLSQTRTVSILMGRSVLRDCGLLNAIARDRLANNLARRHSRLSAVINQVLLTSVVDIVCEEDEGKGDDELAKEHVSDEDEILRVGLPLSAS